MKTQTQTKAKARNNAKAKQTGKAQHVKPSSVYCFDLAPLAHQALRAYFLAFFIVQNGRIAVGDTAKLWPGANVSGHLATGKVERTGNGAYKLTAQGYNAFTDESSPRMPTKEMQADMTTAVKTGKAPKYFNHKMIEMKLA